MCLCVFVLKGPSPASIVTVFVVCNTGEPKMLISRRSFVKESVATIGASVVSAKTFGRSSRLWLRELPIAPATGSSGIPIMVCQDFSKSFDPAYLANGLIGIRPGPNPLAHAQTMVSGFVFSQIPYRVESLSPAPYPLETDLVVDRVSLLAHPELVKVKHQSLDMANGELLTEMVFAPGSRSKLQLKVLQFASRSVPSLLCQEITLVAASDAHFEVIPRIGIEGVLGTVREDRPPERTEVDLMAAFRSHGDLSTAGVAVVFPDRDRFTGSADQVTTDQGVTRSFALDAKSGETYRFRTIAAMVSQFYHPVPGLEAIRLAKWGEMLGFDYLREQNQDQWKDLWKSRVKIEGGCDDQRVLDAAFFYLHSSLHPSSKNGMAPFGLSQFAYYYGHSFWDTETWSLLPVLLASPATAKGLLEFRVRGLESAKKLAALYGYRGAQFPWEAAQTDGVDVTPTFASTGWEEQHVTPDVALGFWQYQLATSDPMFLKEGTWPVLKAVAEWIESRGVFTQRGFEIQHIMGPDEGVPDINNNSYMNLICRMVLTAAARCAAMLGITPPPAWDRIARSMVIPIAESRKVVLPYDHPRPGSEYSLLNMDALMVFDPPLSAELLRNTYEYEKELRRSSPPGIGFATAALATSAAFFGDRAKAAEWFDESWRDVWLEPFGMIRETATEDYGCFLTNFGSLLQTVMLGFTGLRINEGDWNKYPASLPEGWTRIEIDRVWVRGTPARLLAENGKKAELLAE